MSSNDKASVTALVTVSLRALANYESSKNIKINDPLAEIFLQEDRELILSNADSREMIKKSIQKDYTNTSLRESSILMKYLSMQ